MGRWGVTMAVLAAALAACAPASDPQSAAPAPASADPPAAAPAQPRVTIGEAGGDTVQRWQAPAVDLGEEKAASVRERAARALKEDRLFEQADAAIPLYLALLQRDPQDRLAKQGLQQAQRRLLQDGHALLAQTERQGDALDRARALAIVALTLSPEDTRVREFQADVERAQRLLGFNRAGEDDLRNDRIGEEGNGAIGNFREALKLAPENSRAHQGLAAAESALIGRAEAAAAASDFQAATRWLASAAKLRDRAPSVDDARARVEAVRHARIGALHDAALRDLTTPAGLKPAGEKLAEVLRIAAPGDAVAAALRVRLELATHYGSFRPRQVFTDAMQDGGRGPQMIVVPHGAFRMGAGDNEPGASDNERPAHYVRFARGFAMSITTVTVDEFRQFVESANARPRATRRGHSIVYDERSGNFARRSGVDWQSDYNGARAAPNSPVMHVSVRDAEAYAKWLSEQTGRHYRLPTEAEFEYALRAGSQGRYPWGDAGTPPEGAGNFTGGNDVSPSGRHWNNAFVGYGDGFWGPAPVASFRANAWGLWDLGGNLSEWVGDCWHASYRRAPADGAAWFNPGCRQRVIRGGSWANSPQQTRAAWRLSQDSDTTSARIGFRLVRGI
ncbi:formylglycine-generating enzyme family protein [Stenotrophomonas panacihumi]|nr:formylglycine-generating enzyme family protein [Stenotrophomonas panacihumi]PTN54685.1 formylglycine-generating enzyme family protein [Stenotrophomonas panacihumi]